MNKEPKHLEESERFPSENIPSHPVLRFRLFPPQNISELLLWVSNSPKRLLLSQLSEQHEPTETVCVCVRAQRGNRWAKLIRPCMFKQKGIYLREWPRAAKGKEQTGELPFLQIGWKSEVLTILQRSGCSREWFLNKSGWSRMRRRRRRKRRAPCLQPALETWNGPSNK